MEEGKTRRATRSFRLIPQGMRPCLQEPTYKSVVENWYNLVSIYTRRKLTVPSERVLAISGTAKRYSRIFSDAYLASLWKSIPCAALLWTTPAEGNPIPRLSEYQGPL
jgi:hypothetical protein